MKPLSPQTPQAPQKQPKYGPVTDIEETFGGILDSASKVCLWGGLVLMIIAIAGLALTYQAFLQANPNASVPQGMSNIDLLSKLLYVGCIAAMAGSTFIWWGEETLGVFQIALGGIIWASPFWIPPLLGAGANGTTSEVSQRAVATIQMGGTIFGGLAIMVLVADIAVRVRQRAQQGSRADQLKYGKGLKEESDIRNVFMGKCWQLPFCRKFVRESCPIYHAKRTCWRERVGCMCEEEVIRKAMTGGTVATLSKDTVAAARFIPVNNRLNLEQKKERCRQCVIYNEHQKHKYKLALPMTVLGFALIYIVMRTALLGMTTNMIGAMDRILGNFSYGGGKQNRMTESVQGGGFMFQEVLLICLMIVVLAYVLKVLEYLIFKLKV